MSHCPTIIWSLIQGTSRDNSESLIHIPECESKPEKPEQTHMQTPHNIIMQY